MKTVNSIPAFNAQLMKKVKTAVVETLENSSKDLYANIDSFYYSPEEGSSRNGRSQHNDIQTIDHTVTGGIYLDVGYQCNPSIRNAHTIYYYAKERGLDVNSEFWQNTKETIYFNMRSAFGKQFQ